MSTCCTDADYDFKALVKTAAGAAAYERGAAATPLERMLLKLSDAEIKAKQAALAKYAPRFVMALVDVENDALDIMLKRVLADSILLTAFDSLENNQTVSFSCRSTGCHNPGSMSTANMTALAHKLMAMANTRGNAETRRSIERALGVLASM